MSAAARFLAVDLGCYVVIAFYSYVGHRMGKPRGAGAGLAAEA